MALSAKPGAGKTGINLTITWTVGTVAIPVVAALSKAKATSAQYALIAAGRRRTCWSHGQWRAAW